MARYLTGTILVLVSGACAAAAQPARARELALTPAQIERMQIEIQGAEATEQQPVALLPGTVVPAMNARIVAAAPFSGTAVQIHVLPGQSVAAGAPLATISSRELIEAESTRAEAEAELQAADAIARRRRLLSDKNIQSPTLAEEAEAQVAKLKAVVEKHARVIALAGARRSQDSTYTISAPAAGRVVETSILPGNKIEAMAAAVTIDTSDALWIEVQLPAHLVSRIKLGDQIQVLDGPEGKIISVAGSLDRMTRSAKLIASIPSNSGLVAGQMVTLTVKGQAASGALSVPASAVTRVNNVESVFVRNDKGFTLVPVEVAGRTNLTATILGNIANGAKVAASGIPQLEQLLEAE